MDSGSTLNKKAEEIEAVYKEALGKLASIQHQEMEIITSAINKLKEKRLAELRDLMAGLKTKN